MMPIGGRGGPTEDMSVSYVPSHYEVGVGETHTVILNRKHPPNIHIYPSTLQPQIPESV